MLATFSRATIYSRGGNFMENLLIFENANWLNSEHNQGYGKLPIPVQRDEQITRLMLEWGHLNVDERELTSSSITESQAPTFYAYSQRMASLAVRTAQQKYIVLGLLAVGVQGWNHDRRDDILILSLHFDASNKLGISPELVFKSAAELLAPRVKSALKEFLARSPEDQSIQAMGYIESNDSEGFRYKRTW